MMEFAEKVRTLLKQRRLTQADLAEMLGTNQQQVSRWLEKGSPPKWDYLLKLAKALGVTCDYLIDCDQAEFVAAHSDVTTDEQYVLKTVRAFGLTFEDAVRRLAGEGSNWSGSGRVVARQDVNVQAAREQAEVEGQSDPPQPPPKRRLGFETESDIQGADLPGLPFPRLPKRRR